MATVLLVGAVIIIALVIWFWYAQVIQGATEKSNIQALQACSKDVDFEIQELCQESTTSVIRMSVENRGIPIARFRVTFFGEVGAKSADTSLGVSTGTTQQITINQENVGTLEKLEITPFIVSGEPIYCEDQTKEVSSIATC